MGSGGSGDGIPRVRILPENLSLVPHLLVWSELDGLVFGIN